MYAVLNSLLFMSTCMTFWMCVVFTHQNMCITPKIQLLHLNSDFITLEVNEGLRINDDSK